MTLQQAKESGENQIVAQDSILQAAALPLGSQVVALDRVHGAAVADEDCLSKSHWTTRSSSCRHTSYRYCCRRILGLNNQYIYHGYQLLRQPSLPRPELDIHSRERPVTEKAVKFFVAVKDTSEVV